MAPPLRLVLILRLPTVLRAPALLITGGPIVAGLAATMMPAFGYWPTLGGNGVSLAPWRELLALPGFWTSVGLSLWTGLASTALATGATLLIAGGLWGTRAFRGMQRALSPLLALPHAAFALGFAFLVAPSGLFVRAISPWITGWQVPPDLLIVHDAAGLALIAALACKEMSFLLLLLLAAAPQADATRSIAAARSLGYGRFWAFLLCVWPRIYPALRLPVRAVLAYSAANVDMARILGPLLPGPLAVETMRLAQDPDLAHQFTAAAGAAALVLVVAASFVAWSLVEKTGAAMVLARAEAGLRGAGEGLAAVAAGAAASLVAGIAILALVSLAGWSIATRWTFPDLLPSGVSWAVLGRQSALSQAMATTLALGLASALAALAACIAYLEGERLAASRGAPSRGWAMALFLPLLLPDLAVVLGLKAAAASAGLAEPLPLVLLAHMSVVLPYTLLSLAGPWRRLDPRYGAVGRTLGLTPWQVLLRIRLPLLARPLFVAVAVGFSVSASQYLSTLVLGGGRIATLATETVALAGGGDRRVAASYGLALAALPFAAFWTATLTGHWLARGRKGMLP